MTDTSSDSSSAGNAQQQQPQAIDPAQLPADPLPMTVTDTPTTVTTTPTSGDLASGAASEQSATKSSSTTPPPVDQPMQIMPRPTVGRIVHYHPHVIRGNDLPKIQAAIVTAVHSATCVNLRVIADNDGALTHHTSVMQREAHVAHHGHWWDWPERV